MSIEITWHGTDQQGVEVTICVRGSTIKEFNRHYAEAATHLTNLRGLTCEMPMPAKQAEKTSRLTLLSQRELEVYELMKKGLMYKEMAIRLSVSIHTIGSHVKAVQRKLNLKHVNAWKSEGEHEF